MTILGIETSCDETAAALITGTERNSAVTLLSQSVATSLSTHALTGGIIPENAAREQVKFILPVIEETLQKGIGSSLTENAAQKIDAIAVTYGPGLIGSLLVGVETAKTLAALWNKPIIPVNHMIGHVYANFIHKNSESEIRNPNFIEFPMIALVVSGGHTDLLLITNHGNYQVLGGTRDDAAGEAFDKIGRILGLPYPGGPAIEQAALHGGSKRFRFPRPLHNSDDFDFSFSGLKTAVYREAQKHELNGQTVNDISAGVLDAIISILVQKTMTAAKRYNTKSILLSGGVAANQALRNRFKIEINKQRLDLNLSVPPKDLCTDNAAMIASAAFFNQNKTDWQQITADPALYY
jgi:N6-L-threonylcarbamoyladenine synthase